jgi:hypothetical protein
LTLIPLIPEYILLHSSLDVISNSTAWSCSESEPPGVRVPQPLTTEREPAAGSVLVSEIGATPGR